MNRIIILGIIVALLASAPMPGVAGEDEGKLSFSGDLRGRFESFWFDEDATGSDKKENRDRIRYRLRLDAKAKLNERAAVAFRIGTGASDSRSGNQTLGDGIDFGADGIAIRNAYLILMPFADGKLPSGDGHLKFHFGRVPNPLVWKNGQDKMIWDNDIALSGAIALFDVAAGDNATLLVNGGWYQIDENSSGRDPFLAAIQGGVIAGGDAVTAGVKATYHVFSDLDTTFLQRGAGGSYLDEDGDKVSGATSSGGNILDGLSDDYMGGSINVIHVQGFVKGKPGDVPVTAFGGYSVNTSAQESMSDSLVDKEEVAYSAGIEGGDKKKHVKLGVAWFHIQANAFPSQFIDSDFLDGRTNREGVMVYGSRAIMKNTEFGFKLYNSDAIDTEDGFAKSVANSKRTRLQVDLVHKF